MDGVVGAHPRWLLRFLSTFLVLGSAGWYLGVGSDVKDRFLGTKDVCGN